MAESIYESLGVRTVIDAWGTVTALGGSLMAPEVLQALQSAAGAFVDMSELIAACDLNCCPNYGIGRPMKVDKENICGLVKAVELFVQRDYDQIMAQWDSYVDTIRAGLSDCPGLEMTIGIPTEPGVQPACIRRLFLRPLTMPAAALRQALIDGEPSIYTFLYQDQIVINPQCLQAHELSPIVQAIRGILMQHR